MERLVEVVQRTAASRAARFVGREQEVLVEGPSRTDPSRLRGRLRQNITCNFTGSAAPGTLATVLVDGSTSTTLSGRAVEVAVPAA
jgi:tRNA-2-methylthio-N6-dimethylallyladenosine synthase